MFGFGMQDIVGQTQGLIAARAALTRRLRASAADGIDRRKLRPLLGAIAAGNRELRRLAAHPAGDLATLAERVARLDAWTRGRSRSARSVAAWDSATASRARHADASGGVLVRSPERSADFRIRGPLEVWHADRPVRVRGEGVRALLALLLLHAR
jgi:hypothetical protein